MNHKAFTLIELLVVVAIIGILAAVGVVAYNGYTSAAKKNAIKSNFKMTAKYASAELMKCQIGEDNIFINSGSYKVSCNAIHDQRVSLCNKSFARLSLSLLPVLFSIRDTSDKRPWVPKGWLVYVKALSALSSRLSGGD